LSFAGAAEDYSFLKDVIAANCVECHGVDKQKADIRFDRIDFANLSGNDVEDLAESLEQVVLFDMPPPKKSELSEATRLEFHTALSDRLNLYHEQNREAIPHVPAKLTKQQFVNSLENLLSVKLTADTIASLPGDKSGEQAFNKKTFNNNRHGLGMTLLHFELYGKCVEEALAMAIPDEAPAMAPFWALSFSFGRDEKGRISTTAEKLAAVDHPSGMTFSKEAVQFPGAPSRGNKNPPSVGVVQGLFSIGSSRTSKKVVVTDTGIQLDPLRWQLEIGRSDLHYWGPNARLMFAQAQPPTSGTFRITAWASKADESAIHPKLSAFAGSIEYFVTPHLRSLGVGQIVDAPIGRPKPYTFWAAFRDLPKGKQGLVFRNDHFSLADKEVKTAPSLIIERLQVEGPYYESWPTKRERNIFIDRKANEGDGAYAKRVIDNFLFDAFRGEVAQLKNKYFAFWESAHTGETTLRQSIRATFQAILLSPYFLYIDADNNKSRNQELAAKLAYFLWNQPPTRELLRRAGAKEWRAESEIDYLINDPRIDLFLDSFLSQWLLLKDNVDEMECGRIINRAMNEEPLQFVKHLIREDLSLGNLIESDFLVLNDHLMRWYGLDGKQANGFRRVPLPADSPRGGVMTMGAVLRGNSNELGKSAPILRGVWVCERILGRELPPPPMNVEFPDPDGIEGFEDLPVREQMEFHMNHDACYGCHRRIDPLGLPFEEFDGYGRSRAHNFYYTLNAGKKKKYTRNQGAETLAMSTIRDVKVDGVVEFKRLMLLSYKDEVVRAFVRFLYGYAVGRQVKLSERETIDEICQQVKASGDKPRTLIELIVKSDAFSNPKGNRQ
jgi:hypothetical protein